MDGPTRRPNVLLLNWHDLGTHLGCYGNASVSSPSLDAFAGQGLRFERAFSTAPQCSPARGALLTGRYPHSNGLMGLTHRGWELHSGERTLPALLAEHGYRTALAGLQHESADPRRLGYEEVPAAADSSRHCEPVADLAVDWLRSARGGDRPWLLTVGFFEVHRPYPAERYQPDDPGAVHVPGHLPDNPHTRADLAAFHGAIRAADAASGRVLAALDDGGLRDDTLVLFTTDHGIAFPGAKGTLYDPGLRVSLLVRPPASWQVPTGVRNQLVSHLDVAPTLLQACGAAVPDEVQGVSFLESLRDGDRPGVRDELFAEKTHHDSYDPMRCVRTERYKLIRNYEPGPRLVLPSDIERSPTRAGMDDRHLRPRPEQELYDLRHDPWERHNLAEDPGHADLRDRLAGRLERWRHDTGDPLLHGPVPAPGEAGQPPPSG